VDGSCFTFADTTTAQNLLLDCAGFGVFGTGTGVGIGFGWGVQGAVVKNCYISGFETNVYAETGTDNIPTIYLFNDTFTNSTGVNVQISNTPFAHIQNVSIVNSTGYGLGTTSSSPGLIVANSTIHSVYDVAFYIFDFSSNYTVSNVTVISDASTAISFAGGPGWPQDSLFTDIYAKGATVGIDGGQASYVLLNNVTSNGIDADSWYFNLTNSSIRYLSGIGGGTSLLLMVINTTLDRGNITFADVPTSDMTLGWYVNFTVKLANGTPVSGASIYATPSFGGSPIFIGTSDVQGNIAQQVLTEFHANGSFIYDLIMQSNYTPYNPWTFNVYTAGYADQSVSVNVTESKNILLTLSPLSCGTTIMENTTLLQDMTMNGTGACLSIAGTELTLDCNGFSIRGSNRGFGIYNPGYQNVTIKDCDIRNFSAGIAVMGGTPYTSDANTRGLWHLDDSGTTATDSAPYGNNGLANGSASGGFGRFATSFSFDGVNDYVEMPDSTSLDITGPITVEAWIYRTVDSGGREELVSKWLPAAGGQRSYSLSIDANDRPTFRISRLGGGVSSTATGTTTIALDTWYHIAGTYNGSVTRIYVNSVLEDTSANYLNGIFASVAPLRFGVESGGANYFAGKIDEVRILNKSVNDFTIPHTSTYNHFVSNSISDMGSYGVQVSLADNNSMSYNYISRIGSAAGSGILLDRTSLNSLFANVMFPGTQRSSLNMLYDSFNNSIAEVSMCFP
jgi:hypothetical protein